MPSQIKLSQNDNIDILPVDGLNKIKEVFGSCLT